MANLFRGEAARTYDRFRFWPYERPRERVRLLAKTLQLDNRSTLLDVGCGTGFYVAQLAKLSGCRTLGLDFTDEMLRIARSRRAIDLLIRGTAEELPIRKQSLHAVLCHHAIHHFSYPENFVVEARRILVSGGHLGIVTVSHAQMRQHPIYRLFPHILRIDIERIPDAKDLRELLLGAGFLNVRRIGIDNSSVGITWRRIVAAARERFMSSMRVLSSRVFEESFRRFSLRVSRRGGDICPAESYTITCGVAP